MRTLAVVAMTLLAYPLSAAPDHPTVGLVYNTKEASSLNYDCSAASSDTIECTFTQISVRKKATPEDLAEMLATGRQQWKDGDVVPKTKDCETYADLLDALEGRSDPPKGAQLALMSSSDREFAIESTRLLIDLCDKKTEDGFLALVRADHRKQSRTCLVRSNPFSQTFRYVGAGKAGAWVTDSKADGPCGIVQLSRFELDTSNDYEFWRYFARKAVTIPTGVLIPKTEHLGGGQCSDLDQAEYLYDWRARTLDLGCDLIEFTP